MTEDDEMQITLVEDYIRSLVHEYEDLLWTKVEEMQKHNNKITYLKIKRLKKNALFTLLRKVNK